MSNENEKILDFVSDILTKARATFLKKEELFKLFSLYGQYSAIIRTSFPQMAVRSLPYRPPAGSCYIVDTSFEDENSNKNEREGMNGIPKKTSKIFLRSLLFDGYDDGVNTRQDLLDGKRPSTQVMKSMIFGIADIRVTYFNLACDGRQSEESIRRSPDPMEVVNKKKKIFSNSNGNQDTSLRFNDEVQKTANDFMDGTFDPGLNFASESMDPIDLSSPEDNKHQFPLCSNTFSGFWSSEKMMLFSNDSTFKSIKKCEKCDLQRRVYTCPTFPSMAIVLYNSNTKPKKNIQLSKKISKDRVTCRSGHCEHQFQQQQSPTQNRFSRPERILDKTLVNKERVVCNSEERVDYFSQLRVRALAPNKCSIKGGENIILVLNKKIKGPIHSIEVDFCGIKVPAKVLNLFTVQSRVPPASNSGLLKPFLVVNKELTIANKRCNFSYLSDPFEEFNKDIKNILDLDESETNNDVHSVSHYSKNDSVHESQDNISLNEKSIKHSAKIGNPQNGDPKFFQIFGMTADDEIIKQDHHLEEERIQEDLETFWGMRDVADMGSLLNLDWINNQDKTFFENARIIQKNIRGWISRRRYCMLKNAVIKLQKRFKMSRRDK